MRPATPEDIPHIVAMGARFHAGTGQIAPYDTEAVAVLLAGMIESPGACLLVTPGGMIGGMLCPAYCAPAHVMAVELFWWAEDRAGLKLLAGFEAWAKTKGAAEIRMTTICDVPGADKILARKGYRAAEISYSKVT